MHLRRGSVGAVTFRIDGVTAEDVGGERDRLRVWG